jgi:hypothetical protein
MPLRNVLMLIGFFAGLLFIGWLLLASGDDREVGGDRAVVVVPPPGAARAGPSMPRSITPTAPAADPLPAFAQRFASEARQADWAAPSEALLNDQLGSVPMQSEASGLKIRCNATLCAVRGFAPAGLDAKGREIYWTMVQGPAVRKFMAERALNLTASKLSESGAFEIYYARAS